MANEAFYEKMAVDLATAKKQLEAAEDLIEFAQDSGMAITIDETAVQGLKDKVAGLEAALAKRGYVTG